MSPVQQLEQSIQKLRNAGNHSSADKLQDQLDAHNSQADAADLALKAKQAEDRNRMGF